MRLKNITEAGLIKYLGRSIKTDSSVIRGIGDDCAVLKFSKDKYLLVTSDMLAENVHFNLSKTNGFQIGRKALGCGLSDIAAMGGWPRYAVVSIGLPSNFKFSLVKEIYRGLKSLAAKFKVNIIGGDTNSSKYAVLDLTVIGEVKKKNLVLRRGAKKGDIIVVSGSLGGSIRNRHLHFMPRIKEAQFLVNSFKINSMIDISDGLSSDLTHIIEESRKGAIIFAESIPLSSRAKTIDQALNDGEDFELLFTLSVKEAQRLFSSKNKLRKLFTPIGVITEDIGQIIMIDSQGRGKRVLPRGFSHFK